MRSSRRVKVYMLSPEGIWQDKGNGHIQVVFAKDTNDTFFVVESETEPQMTLLESRIVANDNTYERQQETLIVWKEPDTKRDLAISFQDVEGCDEVWDLLNVLRGVPLPGSDGSDFVLMGAGAGANQHHRGAADMNIDFPVATLENLPQILELVQAHKQNVEHLVFAMLSQKVIHGLLDLFEKLEAKANYEGIYVLAHIFRLLLFYNDVTFLENITASDMCLPFIGILEYDPRIPPSKRMKHRETLTSKVQFKSVVPIENKDFLERIHMGFRLHYLKDVILAGVIDEPVLSTINSFCVYSNVELLNLVKNDPDMLRTVLSACREPEMTTESFLDHLCFIQELCELARYSSITGRAELYGLLSHLGLFQVLELALKRIGNTEIRTRACEIINVTLSHNVALLREYVLSQLPETHFIGVMVEGIISETAVTGAGLKAQFCGVLTAMLDPEVMDKQAKQERILGAFYDKCMARLVTPLDNPSEAKFPSLISILELLEFCVRYHQYRIKYFILGNNVINKVLELLKGRNRVLQLGAVRLMRIILGLRDGFYERHITRHHFLDPLVELLVANGGRNNLIDSALADLFEMIRKDQIVALQVELVDRHRDVLQRIEYVPVFRNIVSVVDDRRRAAGTLSAQQQQQQQQGVESGVAGGVGEGAPDEKIIQGRSPKKRRTDGPGEDEDAWFDGDDEAPAQELTAEDVDRIESLPSFQRQNTPVLEYSLTPPMGAADQPAAAAAAAAVTHQPVIGPVEKPQVLPNTTAQPPPVASPDQQHRIGDDNKI